MPRWNRTVEQLFWDKVNKIPDGCWEWSGAKLMRGYGVCWDGDRRCLAHRFVLRLFSIEIPQGLEVDHLCRNTSCVNPVHLDIVSHRTNVIRGLSPELTSERIRAKTHCPHGHPYDAANTYFYPTGYRSCIVCRKRDRVNYRRRRQC